jgi:plasmid stability protein
MNWKLRCPNYAFATYRKTLSRKLERRAALKQISVEDEIRGILEAAALQFCEEEAARASQSARR